MTTLLVRLLVVALCAPAFVFGGVALAQDTGECGPDGYACQCAAAGGTWQDGQCFSVWCGWEDDPPICAYMAGQGGSAPVATDEAPASAPEQSTPEPSVTQAQPPEPTPAAPAYTG